MKRPQETDASVRKEKAIARTFSKFIIASLLLQAVITVLFTYSSQLGTWYSHHDNVFHPYSKLYGMRDGFRDTTPGAAAVMQRPNFAPSNVLRVELLTPRPNSIAAFNNMLEWRILGKAVTSADYYKTLPAKKTSSTEGGSVRRDLVVRVLVDHVTLPVPGGGRIEGSVLDQHGVNLKMGLDLEFYKIADGAHMLQMQVDMCITTDAGSGTSTEKSSAPGGAELDLSSCDTLLTTALPDTYFYYLSPGGPQQQKQQQQQQAQDAAAPVAENTAEATARVSTETAARVVAEDGAPAIAAESGPPPTATVSVPVDTAAAPNYAEPGGRLSISAAEQAARNAREASPSSSVPGSADEGDTACASSSGSGSVYDSPHMRSVLLQSAGRSGAGTDALQVPGGADGRRGGRGSMEGVKITIAASDPAAVDSTPLKMLSAGDGSSGSGLRSPNPHAHLMSLGTTFDYSNVDRLLQQRLMRNKFVHRTVPAAAGGGATAGGDGAGRFSEAFRHLMRSDDSSEGSDDAQDGRRGTLADVTNAVSISPPDSDLVSEAAAVAAAAAAFGPLDGSTKTPSSPAAVAADNAAAAAAASTGEEGSDLAASLIDDAVAHLIASYSGRSDVLYTQRLLYVIQPTFDQLWCYRHGDGAGVPPSTADIALMQRVTARRDGAAATSGDLDDSDGLDLEPKAKLLVVLALNRHLLRLHGKAAAEAVGCGTAGTDFEEQLRDRFVLKMRVHFKPLAAVLGGSAEGRGGSAVAEESSTEYDVSALLQNEMRDRVKYYFGPAATEGEDGIVSSVLSNLFEHATLHITNATYFGIPSEEHGEGGGSRQNEIALTELVSINMRGEAESPGQPDQPLPSGYYTLNFNLFVRTQAESQEEGEGAAARSLVLVAWDTVRFVRLQVP